MSCDRRGESRVTRAEARSRERDDLRVTVLLVAVVGDNDGMAITAPGVRQDKCTPPLALSVGSKATRVRVQDSGVPGLQVLETCKTHEKL